MTYNIEATVKQVLWHLLENQNMDVGAEVKLDNNKKIDLVAKQGQNYIGFEIKELRKFQEDKLREIKIINQILEYANSACLDRLYLCSPDDEIHNFRNLNSDILITDVVFRYNYPDEYQKFIELCHLLPKIGTIKLPLFISEKLECLDKADTLNRIREPNVQLKNEERIKHYVWDFFAHKIPICQGVLPQPDGKSLQYIDILIFCNSNSPLEIFGNQGKMDIIGIEVKNSIKNKDITQITKYLNSFCLTRLYLAVPDKLIPTAKSLLTQTYLSENNKLQQIGLVAVNESGHVQIIKEAAKLEMKYDSILIKSKGLYSNEILKRINIGWGDYINSNEWDRYQFPFTVIEESRIRRAVKSIGRNEYL